MSPPLNCSVALRGLHSPRVIDGKVEGQKLIKQLGQSHTATERWCLEWAQISCPLYLVTWGECPSVSLWPTAGEKACDGVFVFCSELLFHRVWYISMVGFLCSPEGIKYKVCLLLNKICEEYWDRINKRKELTKIEESLNSLGITLLTHPYVQV